MRKADDSKPWTIAAASFNGFDWLRVSPKMIEVKTVKVKNPARLETIDPLKPFKNPAGLELWAPKGGKILIVPGDR